MDADATRPIALSISTLHRADGLSLVPKSPAGQRVAGAVPDLVAVVVNNDPSDPAPRRVAAEIAERTGLAIEVFDEPKRGIAPPRNRGLAAAIEIAGDSGLVGFIDDDEEAPEGWLEALLRVKHACGAEIVTGPVEPVYESPPPAWIEQGRFFDRTRLPTGTLRRWAFTNNILFDASLPKRLDRWFDDSFLRLGEDRHFFERLARSGARIVWADAVSIERSPADDNWSSDEIASRNEPPACRAIRRKASSSAWMPSASLICRNASSNSGAHKLRYSAPSPLRRRGRVRSTGKAPACAPAR